MGHSKLTNKYHYKNWPKYLKDAKGSSEKLINDFSSNATPLVVLMDSKNSAERLSKLISENSITQVIDSYDEQFAELQLSLNAHLYRANEEIQKNSIEEELDKHYGDKQSWQLGAWVYFPWNGHLIHTLEPEDFLRLRTVRNRDLINNVEQKKFYNYSVTCVGMSVGSASALSLVISGASRQIKIADGAVISGSNLNRIMTGISSVGLEKSLVIARQLYEMNPFIEVGRYGKITKSNIEDLFDKDWKTSAIIDEIDDLETKIRLRIEARKRKLPVFMATELADSVMLDVERFDLEPERPLFHGLIPDVEKIIDKPEMNHREWMKRAVQIIGTNNMPLNMQHSLLKIGSSIVTHPQLGSTVMMTGGITTYAIKQVALGKSMPSGRTTISLEKILVPEYRNRNYKRKHKKHTKVMNKALDAM